MKRNNLIKLLVTITILTALIVAYFFTPLNEYLKVEKIASLTQSAPKNLTTALCMLGIFFVGGSLFIPIPLIALATGLIFGIWKAILITIPGLFLASLSGYLIGVLLSEDTLGKKVKKYLDKIKKTIDDKGPWGVMALRVAPTPPFTITSILAGSISVNFLKYSIASILGIMPLAFSSIFFGKGAIKMLKEPSAMAATSLIAAIILFILYKLVKKNKKEKTN